MMSKKLFTQSRWKKLFSDAGGNLLIPVILIVTSGAVTKYLELSFYQKQKSFDLKVELIKASIEKLASIDEKVLGLHWEIMKIEGSGKLHELEAKSKLIETSDLLRNLRRTIKPIYLDKESPAMLAYAESYFQLQLLRTCLDSVASVNQGNAANRVEGLKNEINSWVTDGKINKEQGGRLKSDMKIDSKCGVVFRSEYLTNLTDEVRILLWSAMEKGSFNSIVENM